MSGVSGWDLCSCSLQTRTWYSQNWALVAICPVPFLCLNQIPMMKLWRFSQRFSWGKAHGALLGLSYRLEELDVHLRLSCSTEKTISWEGFFLWGKACLEGRGAWCGQSIAAFLDLLYDLWGATASPSSSRIFTMVSCLWKVVSEPSHEGLKLVTTHVAMLMVSHVVCKYIISVNLWDK